MRVKIATITILYVVGGLSQQRLDAQPPAAPAAPVVPMTPAAINMLFTDADAAFTAKDYGTAAAKIEELLTVLANNPNAPLELLSFNLGLANLLGEKAPEAEAAFEAYLKKFPKGEYTSRCFLGIGRAAILQGTEEKKLRAIEALKVAAKDPMFRSEAGLSLGEVYMDIGKRDEALAVFKSLMGSDVRSPQQTTAAVQVIGLIADNGDLPDLIAYLDRLSYQSGVRDAIAWYSNQVIVRGDELAKSELYEAALALYRTVPPQSQIVEMQTVALASQRKDLQILENRANQEKDKPIEQRSKASELVGNLKPAIQLAEEALKAITDKPDLDAALLMRRGRCLFHLDRYEEALVCFRLIRSKYSSSADAKAAAFAEIVIYNKLKDIATIKELCDSYLTKYPDAENVQQVATLAGEVLVQEGNWAEIGKFYRNLETKFPQSEQLDRFTFFQALAQFQEGNFKESIPVFQKFVKDFPNSNLVENAIYYLALSNFLSNDYKKTLASCKEYLSKFPDGRYAGDMRYRLAFIDFNDKETDQSDKIIRDLSSFLEKRHQDSAAGSMYCLLADTYKKKKSDKADELAKFQNLALEAYRKAVFSESSEDVIQYALDSATSILSGNKDWAGIASLHSEFLKKNPDGPLSLGSASWVAKMKSREGKGAEAAAMLGDALKSRIANPSAEQVEFLIDELVKTVVPPRKKPTEIDKGAVDAQLQEILKKVIEGQENATTNARLYYARARLSELLKDPASSKKHLTGIAKLNADDPSALSPALLSVSGDILLQLGDLEGAERMFTRLSDRYREGLFADAGPVGLGYVALKRNQYAQALKIFVTAIETNPGTSKFKEATVGQLEAMIELGQLDEAQKLATQTAGDKTFRGEFAGKALLLQAKIFRIRAEKAESPEAKLDLLKQAYGTYNRVFTAYKSVPEICAEGAWQAYETLIEMGDKDLANETLQKLATDLKLKNTERAKKAAEMSGK